MRSEAGKMKAKEARTNYNKENYRVLGVNLKKSDYEAFKNIAEERGVTPAKILRDHIADSIASKSETPRFSAQLTTRNLDRLMHETAFHNPGGMNPDQILNAILTDYFKFVDKVRK